MPPIKPEVTKRPLRTKRPFIEFANRKFQIRGFKYLLLIRSGRRGSGAQHLLRVVLDECFQVAMTEACVEIIVLHLGVSLIVSPMIDVEPVDRAHDARAMTAAGAMREE